MPIRLNLNDVINGYDGYQWAEVDTMPHQQVYVSSANRNARRYNTVVAEEIYNRLIDSVSLAGYGVMPDGNSNYINSSYSIDIHDFDLSQLVNERWIYPSIFGHEEQVFATVVTEEKEITDESEELSSFLKSFPINKE